MEGLAQHIAPTDKALFNSSTHFYHVQIDGQGLYACCNERFSNYMGLPATELIGMRADNGLHYADVADFREQLQQSLCEPGSSFTISLRYVFPTPLVIQWEFLSGYPQTGYVTGIGYATNEAIWNNYQEEKATRQINEYLDGITDGFFTLNNHWIITRVNSVFEKVTGIGRDEMLGRSFWDFFPDTSEQPYAAAMRKAFDTGETVTFEQPWPPNYHFAVSAFPSKEGLACYFLDISVQKQQQLELLENQIKLKAILDSTTDVNVLISAAKKVVNFNQMAAEYARTFFHTTLQIGDDFMRFVMPETADPFEAHFAQALRGEKIKLERPLSMPNGDLIWFELLYYPVYSEAGDLLGVAMNLTKIDSRKKAEMKLLQQYDKLREIAYLQSHEARGPLSNILGLINVLMLYKEKNDDPEIHQILDHLSESATKLDEVIQRIVSTTRDEQYI